MNIFFAQRLKNDTFSFYDDDVHHIKDVLRYKIGDKLIVNYDESRYLCEIINYSPLLAQIKQKIQSNIELKSVNISLFQAIIKPRHFEWILSKSTEMQINNFYAVTFERSQSIYQLKINRAENIILNASKQSSRSVLMNYSTISFCEMISIICDYDLILIPYENQNENDLYNCLLNLNQTYKNIAIIIGPEGGFSNREINILKSLNNTKIIKLTNSILRSDTASFYTIANLVSYLVYRNKNE